MEQTPLCNYINIQTEKNSKYRYRLTKFPNLINGFLSRKRKRPRQENSLEELTIDFFKYMGKSGKNIIDINTISKNLNIQKRRIYDITNVLEGNLIIFYDIFNFNY